MGGRPTRTRVGAAPTCCRFRKDGKADATLCTVGVPYDRGDHRGGNSLWNFRVPTHRQAGKEAGKGATSRFRVFVASHTAKRAVRATQKIAFGACRSRNETPRYAPSNPHFAAWRDPRTLVSAKTVWYQPSPWTEDIYLSFL